jgi:hypothetical protein
MANERYRPGYWWQTAFLLWLSIAAAFLWIGLRFALLSAPEPSAARVLWALCFSGIIAAVPMFLLWLSVHWIINKWLAKDHNGNNADLGENPLDPMPFLAIVIGVLERATITTLVAIQVSAVGAFLATWILVKLASGWNRLRISQEDGTDTPENQRERLLARSRAFAGLALNLVSMLFAIVGAYVWNPGVFRING